MSSLLPRTRSLFSGLDHSPRFAGDPLSGDFLARLIANFILILLLSGYFAWTVCIVVDYVMIFLCVFMIQLAVGLFAWNLRARWEALKRWEDEKKGKGGGGEEGRLVFSD